MKMSRFSIILRNVIMDVITFPEITMKYEKRNAIVALEKNMVGCLLYHIISYIVSLVVLDTLDNKERKEVNVPGNKHFGLNAFAIVKFDPESFTLLTFSHNTLKPGCSLPL